MIKDNHLPWRSDNILHGNVYEADKKLLLQWAGLARLQYKHQLEVSLR